MDITITLNEAIWLFVAILLIVLIILLIIFVGKLNRTMKKVDGVLDDTRVITLSAAEKVEKMDEVIDGAYETVYTLVDSVKNSKGLISACGSIASACASLVGLKKKNDK